jgi:C-terminal processing protease CtpA/Prc
VALAVGLSPAFAAYGAKKYRLAQLVGERTAGASLFGGPVCLSDGSLLLLAQSDARIDGERLEGIGIAPDIEVPFDFATQREATRNWRGHSMC